MKYQYTKDIQDIANEIIEHYEAGFGYIVFHRDERAADKIAYTFSLEDLQKYKPPFKYQKLSYLLRPNPEDPYIDFVIKGLEEILKWIKISLFKDMP